MAIIKQHPVHPAADGQARLATPQAGPATRTPIPLMGPADPGTAIPLMGRADPSVTVWPPGPARRVLR